MFSQELPSEGVGQEQEEVLLVDVRIYRRFQNRRAGWGGMHQNFPDSERALRMDSPEPNHEPDYDTTCFHSVCSQQLPSTSRETAYRRTRVLMYRFVLPGTGYDLKAGLLR